MQLVAEEKRALVNDNGASNRLLQFIEIIDFRWNYHECVSICLSLCACLCVCVCVSVLARLGAVGRNNRFGR